MAKRRASLSSRMISTTTGLILVIVALFGILDASHMARIYDQQSLRLSQTMLEAITRRGEVETRDLVQASRGALLQSDYSTLQSFVPQIASPSDRELAYAFVADENGTVLAHTDPTQNLKPVAGAFDRELIAAKEASSKRSPDEAGDGTGRRLLAFSRPIIQEKSRKGTVVIAFDLAGLDEQIQKLTDEKRRANRASTIRTAVIGLIFALFGIALAVLQALRISRPLTLLAWRADQIARGDFEGRADVEGSDEIGHLGESFNAMADHLTVLLRETAEKAILEKELEVARTVQETLVPSPELVKRQGIEVSGYFQPSSTCGGDWWTVHDVGKDKLLLVIGDVTGHGVPAAMITACAKAACDTIRAFVGDKLGAGRLLQAMNHAIHESSKRRFAMTCFAAIVDLKQRTITFANAGHNFPYLYRASSAQPGAAHVPDGAEGGELQVLMARGPRLGDMPDAEFVEKTQALEPGDVLVLYSDGIIECESEAGEEYGEKRFRASIKRATGLGPEAMRESVVVSAGEFYGLQPRKDDITLVFGKVIA